MPESANTFHVGDEVVVTIAQDGHAYLEGEVTAFRGRNAVVKLSAPHTSHKLSGRWLRITRDDGDLRWRDPVSLIDVRLYPRSPHLRFPWGNRQLSTSATMRLRTHSGATPSASGRPVTADQSAAEADAAKGLKGADE
jgi:hypothetical protein